MRLFLSSKNLGKHPTELVNLVGDAKKVAYIGNAKDGLPGEERVEKVKEHKEQFESHGFEFTEIDLRDYFSSTFSTDALDGYGLVWCSGGNTFLLRKAMELSGMDNILVKKVIDSEIAYGGSSAGAVIAGPTLKGTENGDDPTEVGVVYSEAVNWSGLGIVDFTIVPHWESDWFRVSAKAMARQLGRQGVRYEVLADGQVYLIDGSKAEVLR